MARFFVNNESPEVISGADAHHIKNVLRKKIGDNLELLDGSGKLHFASIVKLDKDKVTCKIVSTSPVEGEPRAKITLAQALPKSNKMNFIIEKSTELGVTSIIPMVTERTIGRKAKIERWQKIAKAAAEQSGRGVIPQIQEPQDFPTIIKLRSQFDIALIPWELERTTSLKQFLPSLLLPQCPTILVLIGPEGGFSQKEIDQAKTAGFISVSLGKRILRTETAGLTIIAIINYEFE